MQKPLFLSALRHKSYKELLTVMNYGTSGNDKMKLVVTGKTKEKKNMIVSRLQSIWAFLLITTARKEHEGTHIFF
jgi:hypothetical protein